MFYILNPNVQFLKKKQYKEHILRTLKGRGNGSPYSSLHVLININIFKINEFIQNYRK